MARVIFARRRNIGSWLLRTFMWSPWSHCGIVVGDVVIEAITGHGVVETPLAEFKARSSRWAIVEYPASASLTELMARSQLRKGYDYLGVLGAGLHRYWSSPENWFCSELVAYALLGAGLRVFRLDADRITPQHLWMLDYPVIEWT